jgi:cytochrome c556
LATVVTEKERMKRTLIVMGALLLGAGAVMAQHESIKEVQTLMKGNGKNAVALNAMVKGEKPYNQHAVDTAFAQFEDTAKKLPSLFPDSAKGATLDGDYNPSPKIWEDKTGFEGHAKSFTKVVTEAKSKVKNLDTLKANFSVIGKECSGCHETYRLKKG